MAIRLDLHTSDVTIAETDDRIMEGIIRFLHLKGNTPIMKICVHIPDERDQLIPLN